MARSLSLAAYLAFARRQAANPPGLYPARPEGELVWMHCSESGQADRLARLGQRLMKARDGLSVLMTTSARQPAPPSIPNAIHWIHAPSENPSDIAAFLSHWKPDCELWLGPWLRPALIEAASRRNIPSVLLDADQLGLENRRWRWMPEPTRATVALFSQVLARSPEAATQLKRWVTSPDSIAESGPLMPESPVLPCSETDLEDLSATLRGRPIWLAARVQATELSQVLTAHRNASRMAHRLLLILVPDNREEATRFRDTCREGGFRVAHWEDGVFPDENTQIVLTEGHEELGLWYRAAPLTFMGSSLTPGHGGHNPFEPAALGSAVLHGPETHRFNENYTRLTSVGAARLVEDVEGLTALVGELTAPDALADMAHAGWEVVSEGAEVTDQIIDIVQSLLEEREAA